MRDWFQYVRRFFTAIPARRQSAPRLRLEPLEDRNLMTAGYLQTNIVSDIPGMAAVTDSHLVNPWGLSYGPGAEWWVANAGGGTSTLYFANGVLQSPVVAIPSAAGSAAGTLGSSTGTVFNTAGSGFTVSENTQTGVKTGSSVFLFDTLDGTISGWAPSVDLTHAIAFTGTVANAIYTGLAYDTDGIGRNLLYGADIAKGTIDVYVGTKTANLLQSTTVPGGFVDPQIPSTYTPFNIQNLGGLLYVAYAKSNSTKTDVVNAVGNGFIDVFNSDGVLQQHLVQHGPLNAPWGMALAPANFGASATTCSSATTAMAASTPSIHTPDSSPAP